jgi:hypothetical protein
MTTIMSRIMQRSSLGESGAVKKHSPEACRQQCRQYFVFPGSRAGLRIDGIE